MRACYRFHLMAGFACNIWKHLKMPHTFPTLANIYQIMLRRKVLARKDAVLQSCAISFTSGQGLRTWA